LIRNGFFIALCGMLPGVLSADAEPYTKSLEQVDDAVPRFSFASMGFRRYLWVNRSGRRLSGFRNLTAKYGRGKRGKNASENISQGYSILNRISYRRYRLPRENDTDSNASADPSRPVRSSRNSGIRRNEAASVANIGEAVKAIEPATRRPSVASRPPSRSGDAHPEKARDGSGSESRRASVGAGSRARRSSHAVTRRRLGRRHRVRSAGKRTAAVFHKPFWKMPVWARKAFSGGG
jgi:hypothetical protein